MMLTVLIRCLAQRTSRTLKATERKGKDNDSPLNGHNPAWKKKELSEVSTAELKTSQDYLPGRSHS